MATIIPPIPYKTQLLNTRGYLTDPWAKFIRQLFERVGGVDQNTGSGLLSDIAVNTASIATNVTNINDLQNQIYDLQKGPVL